MMQTRIDDMQAIIDVIPNAVFVKDRRHRIVMVNEAACRFFGYPREVLLACSDSDLFPQDQVRVFHAVDEKVFASGVEHENEERMTDGSGMLRTVITRKRRVRLGDEDYLVAACADVTPYREADRDRYFDLSLDLLCISTPDGYFKNVNPAFRQALGWTEEELLTRPFLTMVHPEDRAATLQELRAQASGHTTENFENRYMCKDGSYRWLAWKAVTAPDGLLYGAARDVTEARAAHDVLAQAKIDAESASRAKSAFLATMSHEIRTPMNGVIGMIEVLERTSLTRDQLDMTRTIRESASALLSIIDDILDFSKIEAGRLLLESEPVSLVDVVEGLSSTLIPVAARKNVRLSTFIAPTLPEAVLSDDTRLRQLLYNLVGNAIKFSGGRAGEPGRVAIEVDIVQPWPLRVAFKVTDNGIGMAPATIANLFVPFNQGEVSTTRRFGGTGLGLAICRRLAELMHGEIRVASEPGVGSSFTVELPFETVETASVPGYDLGGVHCAIVQSTTFDANYLRAYIAHAGADTRVVPDLAAALMPAAGPLVVVHDGNNRLDPPPSSAANVSELVVVPGHRGTARVESARRVVLGADGLRRQTLLHGVAIAVGRAPAWRQSKETPDSGAAVRSAPGIAEARAQGRLVLVAEDDEINQKVILRQLGLLGYAAEVASDGKEALRLWRENRYVLLLTDLHMPQMDGYELAAAIRREEQDRGDTRLPIVALTANALLGESNRAKAAGMDAYLTKPLQLAALKTALENYLPAAMATPDAPIAATEAPAVPQLPSVDFGVPAALVGEDSQAVRELLADYLGSLATLTQELRKCEQQGKAREIGALAHRLKSSSRAMGALALGDLCNELENAGRAEDSNGIAACMQRLALALPDVEREIEAFLAAT